MILKLTTLSYLQKKEAAERAQTVEQVQKAGQEAVAASTAVPKQRSYMCKLCKQPMSSQGHTQFKGTHYCPHALNQIPVNEWLAQQRLKHAAKSKEKQ